MSAPGVAAGVDRRLAATLVGRIRPGAADSVAAEQLAVEAPLELRIGGKPVTVIMRTPGHDEELARGFLFTEGLVRDAADLLQLAPSLPAVATGPGDGGALLAGDTLAVTLAPRAMTIGLAPRSFYASSSCGVCGKTRLADLVITAPPITSTLTVSQQVLAGLPDRLRAAQTVFAATGGLHAAGLFDAAGELLACREDVGRHNAVDKVIGWALVSEPLPLATRVLLVSGRTSYEILQKAIVAGVPIVAAVSAPSSLAVALADRYGLTLVGFLRGGSMNVYTHRQRIVA